MIDHWRTMEPGDREAVATWRYPGIYAFYDLDADTGDREEFLQPPPDALQLAALDSSGEVVGYMDFAPEGDRAGCFAVGLGLRPDRTGRHQGVGFVEEGLREGGRRLRAETWVMRVAPFNLRALRVYERAGFRIVRKYIQATNGAEYPFIELERAAEDAVGRE